MQYANMSCLANIQLGTMDLLPLASVVCEEPLNKYHNTFASQKPLRHVCIGETVCNCNTGVWRGCKCMCVLFGVFEE